MDEQNTTKQALYTTMIALADLMYRWNMLCDDGDRGIGNDSIALILADDGSGKVCTYWPGFEHVGDTLNTQILFDDIEEGVERLMEWLGENK